MDKRTETLIKEIQKWVKQGFTVSSQTEFSASLYKPSMSPGKKKMSVGATMMTFGLAGPNYQPDQQETVYIFIDEKGRVSTTKGKARI